MLLYAYFTPKVDFKRKFNHHRSFFCEWPLTAQTIRKFRIGPSIRIESRIGRTIRNKIKSRSFAGPYYQPVSACKDARIAQSMVTQKIFAVLVDWYYSEF